MLQNKNWKLLWITLLLVGVSACGQSPPPMAKAEAALLSHIPADTRFVFAVTEPLPEPVNEKLLGYFATEFDNVGQQILAQQQNLDDLSAAVPTQPLVMALIEEFSGKLTPTGIRSMGFRLDARSAFYEMGGIPVWRLEIGDPGKVKALIDRIFARTDQQPDWEQAGDKEYLRLVFDDLILLVMITDNELIASSLNKAEEQRQFVSVFGDRLPSPSLAEDPAWQRMIDANDFTGHAQGYIDLLGIMSEFRKQAATPGATDGKRIAKTPADVSPACMQLTESMLQAMPRILVGTSEVESERITTRTKLEMSAPVAAAMQTLVSPMPGVGRQNSALFRYGVSINFPAFQRALRQLLKYLSVNAAGCEWVDNNQMQRSLLTMNMMLGPFLNGFKGIYLELEQLAFAAGSLRPSQLNAYLIAVVEDPQSLFALATMLQPGLAQLQLPADGSPLPIPQQLLPPEFPAVSVAARDRLLGISLGKPEAATFASLLSEPLADKAPLMWMGYDLGKIGRALQPLAETLRVEGKTDMEPHAMQELFGQLQVWGARGGISELVLVASDTGLVIDHAIELK